VSAEEGLVALLLSGAGPFTELESAEFLSEPEPPQLVMRTAPVKKTIKSREITVIRFIKKDFGKLSKNYASLSVVMNAGIPLIIRNFTKNEGTKWTL
jgi:hypothetical protein